MASTPFTAKYAVVSPSGSSSGSTGLLDLDLNFGNVTTVGQNIQYVGSAAVDAVFLRPGVSVNFTASGAGVDKLYLEGNFADYTYKLSGQFVVITRTANGLTESATVAASDTLVFADGFMSTDVLIERLRLKITSSPTLDTSEKSTGPQVQLEGQPSITATALGKTGVTFAQGIQGVALKVVGEAGVDTVYVKAGTEVDASGLDVGQDVIYFTGNYADYTKSVTTNGSPTALVLERTVNGATEKITLATSGDKAVFADGSALTDAIKAKVDANESQATWPADWQPTETTPTAYTDVQAITFDATKSSRVKNGTYKSNDVLVFSVKFKQAVTVGGVPTLALNMGGKTVYAEYDSALTGKSKTDLKFKYTVHSGDVDDNGISVLPSAANTSVINLNGGSINLTSAGSPPAKLVQTPVLKDVVTAKVDALAPLIQASYDVDENTTTAKALKSIDLKANEGVTWSGLSGPDAKAFTLGSSKNAGKLFFKAAADYESQSAFSVTVTGTDAVGNKTTQDLTINLLDVDEAPVVGTPLVNQVFAVGSATNSYTIPRSAFKDANGTLSYTVTTVSNSGSAGSLPEWLHFDAGTQTFTGSPSAVSAPVAVRVRVTDSQGESTYSDFTITTSNAPVVQSLEVTDSNTANGATFGKQDETLTLKLMLSAPVVSTRGLTAVFTVGGKEVTAKHGAISSAADTLTFTLNVPEGANGTVSLKSLVADNKGVIKAGSGSALLMAPKAGAIADQHYMVDTKTPLITATYSVAENTATDTAVKSITLLANEPVTWSALAGANASDFTLGTDANAGKLIFNSAANFEAKNNYKVTITGTDAAGNAKSQDITINLTNVNEAPTGSVTLGGTPTQGQVLTASHTLVDPEGPATNLLVGYKWQVSASGNSEWADISGALGSTFTLTEAQVGKYVRVVASYTDGAGVLETVNSEPTNTAIVNLNDAPIGNLSLTGTPKLGGVLTASHTLTDADGMGIISYQWQTSGNGTSDWVDIIDATDSTYTLTASQVDQFVRVVAHYTDGHGTAEAVNSNTTITAVLPAVIKGFDKYGNTSNGIDESSLTDVVGAKMTDLLQWGWYQKSALLEGTTEAEATVNFTLGGQTRSATADKTGYWNYRLTADDFANVGAGAEAITVTSVIFKNGYTSNTQITRNVTFNAVADTMSHNEDGYGSDYIDALVEGGTGWAGKVITYSFAPGSGSAAWTTTEKTAFKKACATYSNVCNLQFVEGTYSSDSYSATSIVVSKVPNSTWTTQPGWYVLADFNLPSKDFNGMYGALKGRFNYQHSSWSNQIAGGLSFNTIMHELGHGLGLSHPFDGDPLFPGVLFNGWTDLGDNNLSQGIWTIMAYNHDWKDSPAGSYSWGFAKTPMTFDIAAMQAMYGANTTYRTGNNTYTLPTSEVAGTGWECIWDAGGTDTISNSGASADCNINLNAYPKTGGVASESYVSYNISSQIAGGFTIADGAVIENAVGGNGNDTLIGNAVSNQLTGNGGDDKFVFNTALGANNIDTITDFAGTDIVVLDKTIFTAFQAFDGVNTSQLHVGAGATAAADEDDYLIYNTTTGGLYYDQDGSGNTYTAIQFAVLQTKPPELVLTHVLLA